MDGNAADSARCSAPSPPFLRTAHASLRSWKRTSLDLIEFIMSIEDAFDIELSDAASAKMCTVDE